MHLGGLLPRKHGEQFTKLPTVFRNDTLRQGTPLSIEYGPQGLTIAILQYDKIIVMFSKYIQDFWKAGMLRQLGQSQPN
jgi:hypothetical protein